MVDFQKTDPAETHESIWELIPWYVNGSLSDAETALVERHKEACLECEVEIDSQLGVAARMSMLDDFEAPRARSLETLKARIAAEENARAPIAEPAGLASWLPSLRGGLTYAAAGFAAIMLAVMVMSPGVQPDDEGFRTLTSDPDQAGVFIKFQAAGDVNIAVLEGILAQQGLTLAGGPSETGVYRATASEGMDVQAVSNVLMSAPEILFAAPE
ncbi:MAG: zf-HC2 domain-containing protein [Paracoccaceae bacterium]